MPKKRKAARTAAAGAAAGGKRRAQRNVRSEYARPTEDEAAAEATDAPTEGAAGSGDTLSPLLPSRREVPYLLAIVSGFCPPSHTSFSSLYNEVEI